MSAVALPLDPSGVAGPAPGGAPLVPVPAVAPPPAPVGMPQMPGVPPAAPVGPKGANFDPTGTVPVAGSPADPNHPAQQAPPVAPAPPATAEEAAARRYAADSKVADVEGQQAKNAAESATLDETEKAKRAELLKKQQAEQEADDARHEAGLAKAHAEREALHQNTQNFRFHNFWDTRTTGQSILAGLGIILGSASYSSSHVNEAARSIDNAISQEWEQQKTELQRRQEAEMRGGENERETRLQYDYESGQLKLRQARQLEAFAAESDALSARSKNKAGVLAAQKLAAEARALAEQHGQQGVKEIAEAHSQQLKDKETEAQTALANAKAGKAKRAGTGGGSPGRDQALSDFTEQAQNLKPGDKIPGSLMLLGLKAGIKRENVLAKVDALRNSGAKSAADERKAEGVKAGEAIGALPKDAVYLDNQPIGLAPSGRGGAAAVGSQLLKYRNSIKSLEELQKFVKSNGLLGRSTTAAGDLYDRAVLAVAATTQAPGTDRTTEHEANSLKTWKTLDADAIQRSIDHLTALEKDFRGTLHPLPTGFKNAPAPPGGGGPVEGSTSVSAKGIPIVFRNGKWGPQ